MADAGVFPELCVSCRRDPPPSVLNTACWVRGTPIPQPTLICSYPHTLLIRLGKSTTWLWKREYHEPSHPMWPWKGYQRGAEEGAKSSPWVCWVIRFLICTIGQLLRLSTGMIGMFLPLDPWLVLMDGSGSLACHVTAQGQATRLSDC